MLTGSFSTKGGYPRQAWSSAWAISVIRGQLRRCSSSTSLPLFLHPRHQLHPSLSLPSPAKLKSSLHCAGLYSTQSLPHSMTRYSGSTRSGPPVRVAILDTDSVPSALADKYGNYWSVALLARLESALKKTHREPRIEFTTWDVVNGHYPDPSTTDAILLTGGKSSVYWPDQWIAKLQDFVVNVYHNHPRVKMVGVCLGHQVIAHALLKEHGVFVEKNPRGFQMGRRSIDLDLQFYDAFPDMRADLRALQMHVIHGDHVYCPPGALPPGWMSMGKSECCEVHGLYQPGRVFSTQSHFEFTRALCYDIIAHLTSTDKNPFSAETIDALLGDAKIEDDGEVVAGMIISFLTGDSPSVRHQQQQPPQPTARL